ncbi:hypothetical protein ACT31I_001464 [Vibrio cidicii]|nr:hypothetical protein [Vibrio cidicii]
MPENFHLRLLHLLLLFVPDFPNGKVCVGVLQRVLGDQAMPYKIALSLALSTDFRSESLDVDPVLKVDRTAFKPG